MKKGNDDVMKKDEEDVQEEFDNLLAKWEQTNKESNALLQEIFQKYEIEPYGVYLMRMQLIDNIIAQLHFAQYLDWSVHDLLGKMAERLVTSWKRSDDPPSEPWPSDLRNMEYEFYLQTNHWQRMRRTALWWAENRCQTCHATDSLQVHHRTYARKGGERLSDLTVLCRRCHELHPTSQLQKEDG